MEAQCAFCGLPNQQRLCKNPEGAGKGPPFCATALHPECTQRAVQAYQSEELHAFAVNSARNERSCYDCSVETAGLPKPVKCRIEETVDFCRSMGYYKIGFAFCGALHKEAAVVARMFRDQGLEVVSVMCKVGGVDKTAIGIQEEEKLHPGRFEPVCNPIAQAEILNESGTQFNVVMGLCVGHDSLFLAHSQKLCTVLAVKDRLLGHNPLAAVYTSHSYYSFLHSWPAEASPVQLKQGGDAP